jgi:SAM-dependent MidA family methyltransferase
MGGGRGFLAEDILFWAKKNDPEFYGRLQYLIMERAPSFLREQQERLSGEVAKGKLGWLEPGALTGHTISLEGCILSNELVDAFPVHRVVCCGGELQEIYVGEENGRFVEHLGKLSDHRIGTFFPWLGIDLAEGQKAEVNMQALAWLEDLGRGLSRGFIMTIDYGLPAAELYDSCHANGTLRCYFRHQLSDNPYERPGRQDITAHVDFTSLIRKGEELGLRFTGLVPQYRFLIALGLIEEIDARQQKLSAVEGLKLRLSIKHLLEPQRGMGEIFKVLIQHKGIEKPELEGLQDLRQYFNRNKGGVR